MTQTVKTSTWSFSRLGDFAKCRLMYKLKYIDKIPEPERELPPGKSEFANDRGTRLHANMEEYVRGEHDALAPENDKHFGLHADLLRVLYAEGKVEMEEAWGYDRDWEVAPWETAWLRMKVDALVHLSEQEACIVDFKTGKVWGNEIQHAQQLNLYAVAVFLRYPKLDKVSVADWYLDHGEITERFFTRDQALRFKRGFHTQGVTLTDCQVFPANPNVHSCKWCPYSPSGTGDCLVGVTSSFAPKRKK